MLSPCVTASLSYPYQQVEKGAASFSLLVYFLHLYSICLRTLQN